MPIEPCKKTILPSKTLPFPYNYEGKNHQCTITIHNALSFAPHEKAEHVYFF